MFNTVDTKNTSFKDLFICGLIIFITSTIVANLYNPLLGLTYVFGNVLTLTFLRWLYQDNWNSN